MTLVSRRHAVRVAGAAAVLFVATGCSSVGGPKGGGGASDAQAGAAISSATTEHMHGIYRDPTNEYGARYAP